MNKLQIAVKALYEISLHGGIPCIDECHANNGVCFDEISENGKLCPVGIAQRAIKEMTKC